MMPKATYQVLRERLGLMKNYELPRLILTPWGYITRGQALLNYRNNVPHPEQTTVYDPKTHGQVTIDWTEPGLLEDRIGVEIRPE